VEVIIVPRAPGPLIRIAAGLEAGDDLQRRTGVPIDASDPDVADLLDAYEALWAATPLDRAALTAAHTALLETASLLRSAPPVGPAEREYVRRRRRGIADLGAANPVRFLASLQGG
jgi:hypothetical protein